MEKIILFIHGWSEDSYCFKAIRQILDPLSRKNYLISLADFVTLDDTITFIDLVGAMQQAWLKNKLPLTGKNIDVITHSTGGVVLRAWLRQYYPNGNSPVNHVVMLAPPNFGSHLAHKGTAFYGRLYKGLNLSRPFEVGENLLKDLEIGSKFLRDLADFDCFGKTTSFQDNDIMLTILVGASGYDGFAAIANVNCSDGVVPIESASLGPQRLRISYDNYDMPSTELCSAKTRYGFKIIPSLNHSTILTGGNFRRFPKILIDAINVSTSDFPKYCDRLQCENIALSLLPEQRPYQKTLVNVQNQFFESVEDYFIAFATEQTHFAANMNHFHDDFVKSVHCNSENRSIRCLTLDTMALKKIKTKIDISISAVPSLNKKNSIVGYRAHDVANNKALVVTTKELSSLVKPYSFLFLDWVIIREFKESIFRFHKQRALDKIT